MFPFIDHNEIGGKIKQLFNLNKRLIKIFRKPSFRNSLPVSNQLFTIAFKFMIQIDHGNNAGSAVAVTHNYPYSLMVVGKAF
jgi:hypothetical protein